MKSIHEAVINESLATGTNTLSTTPVSPGLVKRLTDLTFKYTGTVIDVRIEIKAGGQTVYKTTADPTSGQWERIANMGDIFLSSGEKIDMIVTTATLNDDAYLVIHGVELPA